MKKQMLGPGTLRGTEEHSPESTCTKMGYHLHSVVGHPFRHRCLNGVGVTAGAIDFGSSDFIQIFVTIRVQTTLVGSISLTNVVNFESVHSGMHKQGAREMRVPTELASFRVTVWDVNSTVPVTEYHATSADRGNKSKCREGILRHAPDLGWMFYFDGMQTSINRTGTNFKGSDLRLLRTPPSAISISKACPTATNTTGSINKQWSIHSSAQPSAELLA